MDDYARAISAFEDNVIKAIVRAEDDGLTTAEIVAELRRIAAQTESE
jgi:hypothetical protein